MLKYSTSRFGMTMAETWLNYKKHNTCKLLIGITQKAGVEGYLMYIGIKTVLCFNTVAWRCNLSGLWLHN